MTSMEDQMKEQFVKATGIKFEEMVQLEFDKWKTEFIEKLKRHIGNSGFIYGDGHICVTEHCEINTIIDECSESGGQNK